MLLPLSEARKAQELSKTGHSGVGKKCSGSMNDGKFEKPLIDTN